MRLTRLTIRRPEPGDSPPGPLPDDRPSAIRTLESNDAPMLNPILVPPERGMGESVVGAKHPRLPTRAPLEFTADEQALVLRIARETFQGLAAGRTLGAQDARERHETWVNSRDWAGAERDPLTTFAVHAISADWRAEFHDVARTLAPRAGALPRFDITARASARTSLRADVFRVLQVTACVPIFATREGVSLVLGSMNPIAAGAAAQHIADALPDPPFTAAMRLTWDGWVAGLEEHGL